MASVYWMRSFVPMLKNSASRAKTSAITTALGTSIIMPSGMCLARAWPAASTSCIARPRSVRTSRSSCTLATIGTMMRRSPWALARTIARSCVEEDVGPREREAHGAQAERRVHLGRELEARRELVAADVERAQRDRARRDGLDDRAIELVLLVLGRHRARGRCRGTRCGRGRCPRRRDRARGWPRRAARRSP